MHVTAARIWMAAWMSGVALWAMAAPAPAEPAKNIIIMISDGMGYAHLEAASLYATGERRSQVYWAFDHIVGCTTYSLMNRDGYDPEAAWADFRWVQRLPTDSAAAGNAISTGEKTHNGLIGMQRDGEKLRHLMADAEAAGKSTGVLSTVRISHATPAAFVAHNASRNNEEEISAQMIGDSALDVLMGPGHPWYDNDGRQVGGLEPEVFETTLSYKSVGGKEMWRALVEGEAVGADRDSDGDADPWTLVQDTEAILELKEGETPERVLGLVPVHSTLQQSRTGDSAAAPFEVPLTTGLPTMGDLMLAALNVLDENENGFVLMGEGGAVDWAGHDNAIGRMIEEQVDFDRAVADVVAWVEEHSSWDETLLIVTSDHECGYLVGPGSDPEWEPLTNNGKGEVPGHEWKSGNHTNMLVPLFAKGAGAERVHDYVRGEDPRLGPYIDNTDIKPFIVSAWE